MFNSDEESDEKTDLGLPYALHLLPGNFVANCRLSLRKYNKIKAKEYFR
jgi:hypothetical protein